MLSRVASRVSMRSREQKLQLFLELLRPGPETSVLDVGVTDAPFGGGSTDNFFEALLPLARPDHRGRRTVLERFAAAFPAVTVVQADGREPSVRRRGLRRSASRTPSSSTSAAARSSGGSSTSSAASPSGSS